MKKLVEVEGEVEGVGGRCRCTEERLIPLLTEIRNLLRENLTAANTLAARRERDAERKRTKRQKGEMSADKTLTENEEREKENSPLQPPIENKGKEEKDHDHDYAGARARKGDLLRQQRVAEVESFRVEIGGDVDPEVFVDYYLSNHRGWPKKWQARYRNWTKNGKRGGRLSPDKLKVKKSKQSYSLADWSLCAERCAAFREGKCTCGIETPPNCNTRPFPPEECPHFQGGTAI